MPAIVRESERAERLQVALIENVVREDLNPIDEARACAALVEDLGLSKEELARRIGRSRPAVSNLIRLLELPDEALALLESGELTEGHGRALLGIRGNDARRRLARDAAKGGWSVRETENRVKLASQPNRKPRPEPVDAERQAALRDVGDELESGLGHEVRVRHRGRGDRRRDPPQRPRRDARAGAPARQAKGLRRPRRRAADGRYHRPLLRAISSVG